MAAADLSVVNRRYNMNKGVDGHGFVTATLAEMGIRAPMRTFLIQKGYFVGHKYRFDGGYAIRLAGKNVIEIYDDDGQLLKAVSLEETDKKDAA
jgi:hypothetical protein